MIEFRNCTFHYEGKALIEKFNALIHNGEKVVLYGPSGSGKSTLLHAVLRFVEPEEGEVITKGTTAWLPQDLSLPYSTTKEMMMAPFEFKANQHNKPSHETIERMMDKLLLEHNLIDKGINEISGGQKQRLLLASALLLQKQILLLDEPTSALDSQSVDATIKTIREMEGVTMLAVSHDEKFINAFDRKIFIPKL